MKRFKDFKEHLDEAKAGETCDCCDNKIDENGKCGCGPDCEHCGGQHDMNEEVFAMDIDYNDEKSLAKAAKSAGITAKFVQAGGATEMQLKGDKNKITKFLKARKVPASEISRGWFEEETELDEVLDTPKAMDSYRNKAKASKEKAASSAVDKIMRNKDKDNRAHPAAELKTMAKRTAGEKMADRNAARKTRKALMNKEEVELDEARGTSAKYAGKSGMFGGKYTSKDRMLDMKAFDKIRNKRAKQRDAEHAKQDPKMRKMGYAKHMLDTDKADDKARKRGIDPAGKYDKYKKRNGIREELDEATINDITAEYINENNITLDELENMTEAELNELIGKAIGGIAKGIAKAGVRAVYNKQGNVRGSMAAKNDKLRAKLDKVQQKRRQIVKNRALQRSVDRAQKKLVRSQKAAKKY